MKRYSSEIIKKVQFLRSQGNTYGEIRNTLNVKIPKSTLSDMCKTVLLPADYSKRIQKLNINNLNKGRIIAVEMNRIKREELLKNIHKVNLPVVKQVDDLATAKIALSMLCLGEASKYNIKKRSCFYLGNSDPRIIVIFLKLLSRCFNYHQEKVRCTVQCRADQDTKKLQQYWMEITKIPEKQFYKPLIDPRTVGKPTLKKDYMGVLRVDYFDTKVQLELESLADLIYKYVC